LAPSFFFLKILPSLSEFTADVSTGVLSRGVGFEEAADSASSSSSTPNESFPLPSGFRFFLKVGFGVEALYFAN
jgi:hypothetical protein